MGWFTVGDPRHVRLSAAMVPGAAGTSGTKTWRFETVNELNFQICHPPTTALLHSAVSPLPVFPKLLGGILRNPGVAHSAMGFRVQSISSLFFSRATEKESSSRSFHVRPFIFPSPCGTPPPPPPVLVSRTPKRSSGNPKCCSRPDIVKLYCSHGRSPLVFVFFFLFSFFFVISVCFANRLFTFSLWCCASTFPVKYDFFVRCPNASIDETVFGIESIHGLPRCVAAGALKWKCRWKSSWPHCRKKYDVTWKICGPPRPRISAVIGVYWKGKILASVQEGPKQQVNFSRDRTVCCCGLLPWICVCSWRVSTLKSLT